MNTLAVKSIILTPQSGFQMFSPFKRWIKSRFSSSFILFVTRHPPLFQAILFARLLPSRRRPIFPICHCTKASVCNAALPNRPPQLGRPRASPFRPSTAPEGAGSPQGVLGRRDQRQPRSPSASSRRARGSGRQEEQAQRSRLPRTHLPRTGGCRPGLLEPSEARPSEDGLCEFIPLFLN